VLSESRRVCAGCDSGLVVQKQGTNLSLHSYRDMPYMEVTRLCVTSIYGRFVSETQCFWKYWGGRRPPRVRKLPAAAALRRLRHPGRGGAFFAKSQRSQLKSQHFKPAGTSSDGRLDHPATCAVATGGLREPDPLLPQVSARAAARLHRVVERLPARRAPWRLASTRAARRPARVARLPCARAGR
jgi:hypothetical protein